MDMQVAATAEEIEYAWGERALYYPYVTPQPCVQINPYTTKRAIGVDENGEEIFLYIVNQAEASKYFAREWLAARKATNGTAVTLS